MTSDATTYRERHRAPAAGDPRPRALFSGGGSGGHVFPGLAVAEELERRGWQVSWAGSEQGMESRLVRRREIPFHALPARPVVGQGLAGKLRAATTLARSAWKARALVRQLDARVVVGTGGYVSAPAVIGARLASRPSLLFEPNAEAGAANRWLSRLADEASVAFEGTASQLACPARATGVPVRSEFSDVAPELPPDSPRRVLVLGGSQGAKQINELVPRAIELLSDKLGTLAVRHQTGEAHLATTRAAYRESGIDEVEVVSFLDRMAEAMGDSHLVISRAGAITLAEICATGRPSLLVPLALAGGHQATNAQRLAESGAAAVLPAAATAKDLARELESLLSDGERLREMARRARVLGRHGSAAAIADQVERLGGTGNAAAGEAN